MKVSLTCALIGTVGGVFPVDIEANKSVGHLKKAIAKDQKLNDDEFVASNLQLFLAKTENGAWLTSDSDDAEALKKGEKTATVAKLLHEDKKLQGESDLDRVLSGMEKTSTDQIHVLVVVPQAKDEQPPRKKAKMSRFIDDKSLIAIADSLNIDTWEIGGVALNINRVEPDFPEWFYVRKESLDIIKIFHEYMEKKLHTMFVGTPGVGKSLLVVLLAFYMALHQQKSVVLFRKVKGKGTSMLYLNAQCKQYWRKEEAKVTDLDLVEDRDFALCLDGFVKKDIDDNFGRLARFHLLATSVEYPMKNDDYPVLRQCLVPFWSSSDLNIIGAHHGWTDHDIKERYYYSGGNLRDFLSEKGIVMDLIDQAVGLVDPQVAQLLNSCNQYALGSARHLDQLWTASIQSDSRYQSHLTKYMMTRSWFCVITSEYALRQLGDIIKPSYYETLWSKGRILGDDGLMGSALENYVHTMAREGKKIELQVRTYDRQRQNQHTYTAVEFKANSYRNEGRTTAECEAKMQQLSGVDYWYPFYRFLVSIDSVAKLNMGGEQSVAALIQITKSDNHEIDSEALDKYVKLFPEGARYIALVPDKETSDKFRLSPADPPTQMPLYVAYIATWN